MWSIFKFFIEFLKYYFCFMFCFLTMRMWDLSFLTRDQALTA